MGTGIAVSADELITHTKMNLKLESIEDADVSIEAAIKGSKTASNARRRYAKAFAILDLSEAAQSDIAIFHTTVAATLLKAILLYTEASSSDAGVTVTIGKETDNDYYYTGASEINEAKWYELEVGLLQTVIAAGDTVVCGNVGGKTGIGEILVCIEYVVDD